MLGSDLDSRKITGNPVEDRLEGPRVGARIPSGDMGPVILQEMLMTSATVVAGGM